MEDRLQKVLEKKKVKNNYKHIEVLHTLNDNTSTDTTVNIENPSPSVTSSTKTVQSDKSESSTNTGKNKKPKNKNDEINRPDAQKASHEKSINIDFITSLCFCQQKVGY